MQLKEQTGNAEMFDVLKKKKRQKQKRSSTARRPKSSDTFSYLNQSLGHGHKGGCERVTIKKCGGERMIDIWREGSIG